MQLLKAAAYKEPTKTKENLSAKKIKSRFEVSKETMSRTNREKSPIFKHLNIIGLSSSRKSKLKSPYGSLSRKLTSHLTGKLATHKIGISLNSVSPSPNNSGLKKNLNQSIKTTFREENVRRTPMNVTRVKAYNVNLD